MEEQQTIKVPGKTIELARAMWGFAGVIFVVASVFFGQAAKIDTATAMTIETKQSLAELKADREHTLEVWRQDRIDNASFKSAVMTKLDRIERKLDR